MNFIENLDLSSGDRVFLRLDLNVPIKDGEIKDTRRIDSSMKTVKYLLAKDCRIIIGSHLGRPSGNGFEEEYSLKPVYDKIEEYLSDTKVRYVDNVLGSDVDKKVSNLRDGQILVLENLRFHPEEKKNGEKLSKELAAFVDYYVNDAFGTLHRKHASVYGLPKRIPVSRKGYGYLIKKERDYLIEKLENPERPYTVVSGGAKVSSKIDLLKSIPKKADTVLIGGGMMFTFLKAMNKEIGKSICEEDKLDIAVEVLKFGKNKIIFPEDVIVVDDIENPSYIREKSVEDMGDEDIGVDLGSKTAKKFEDIIMDSGTVVLNGPMGIFEDDRYASGTKRIVEAMALSKCISIVGGGDSASAVRGFGLDEKMDHISTGGGASLELLSGNELPGFSALEE